MPIHQSTGFQKASRDRAIIGTPLEGDLQRQAREWEERRRNGTSQPTPDTLFKTAKERRDEPSNKPTIVANAPTELPAWAVPKTNFTKIQSVVGSAPLSFTIEDIQDMLTIAGHNELAKNREAVVSAVGYSLRMGLYKHVVGRRAHYQVDRTHSKYVNYPPVTRRPSAIEPAAPRIQTPVAAKPAAAASDSLMGGSVRITELMERVLMLAASQMKVSAADKAALENALEKNQSAAEANKAATEANLQMVDVCERMLSIAKSPDALMSATIRGSHEAKA